MRGKGQTWEEARAALERALASEGDALFARVGFVDGELVETDRHVAGRPPHFGGQELLATVRGGADRRVAGTRIETEQSTLGVLFAPRATTSLATILVELCATLDAFVPRSDAELLLERGRVSIASDDAAEWLAWPPWPAWIDVLLRHESTLSICHGAFARTTVLRGVRRRARLVRLSPAERVARDPLAVLTPAQRRAVGFAAVGATASETAAAMEISPETARSHLRDAYRRLGIASRAELAAIVTRSTGQTVSLERGMAATPVVSVPRRSVAREGDGLP